MTAETKNIVRVIAFPGAPNLPTFAAIEQGFFADENISVDVSLTGSSVEQAQRSAAGEFDVVFTAFDNVVAYAEGQGAAGAGIDPGYVVLMGGTQLELAIVTAPGITDYAGLKGKSVALDALSTGFAFVLFDMFEDGGLKREDATYAPVGATPQRWLSVKNGEHAATLTIEPFTSIARRSGFNVLDVSTRIYDSYQGGVVTARRTWVAENPDAVRAFIRGYLKGLAWTLDPANREAAEQLLQAKMPEIQPAALQSVMNSLLSPKSGLTPDAKIIPEGMKRVLELRSRHGKGGEALADPAKYLDLSHYEAVTGSN
jgi:ABC-type nitrate/sulfonate/bicarbonate transport system substrate-binding protein